MRPFRLLPFILCLFVGIASALAAPYHHAATGITFPDRLGTLPKYP